VQPDKTLRYRRLVDIPAAVYIYIIVAARVHHWQYKCVRLFPTFTVYIIPVIGMNVQRIAWSDVEWYAETIQREAEWPPGHVMCVIIILAIILYSYTLWGLLIRGVGGGGLLLSVQHTISVMYIPKYVYGISTA